ncbi:glycosyltransferase [Salinimicrobium sp. CAU 1759]
MKKSVKVLFLTKYPEKGASSRYRVYQYIDCFESIDFKVQSLLSDQSFRLMYTGGGILKKIFLGLKDYFRRTFFILTNLNADVIYMQREIFAFGPLWAENLFKLLGSKLILDLDDALFINKENSNNPFKWNKAARVKRIVSKSDLVIAGNAWIRDECVKLGAKRAVHIDVAETIQFKSITRPKNRPMKALWLGSPTTSKYLKLIEKPLKRIQEEVGLEINIVGGDPNLNYAFRSNCFAWSKEIEAEYLKISDIGLMPLPMTNWSKGKCGGKARTYMASGLIPVVSNIGYNQDLIKHNTTGFLCNDSEDWYNYLRVLNENFQVHDKIRKSNYNHIETSFNKEKIAKQLEAQIIDITK